MSKGDWTCTGPGATHPAALDHVDTLSKRGGNSLAIERCRSCGALYRHLSYEVNDWGENGDYYSQTEIWTPLTGQEADMLRADPNWRPGTEPAHRWDSGWRAG